MRLVYSKHAQKQLNYRQAKKIIVSLNIQIIHVSSGSKMKQNTSAIKKLNNEYT